MFGIGVRFQDVNREHLQFLAQIGAEGGTLQMTQVPGYREHRRLDPHALRAILRDCREFGLDVAFMEMDISEYRSVLRGDFAEAEGHLARVQEHIRALGDAGVGMVGVSLSIGHADDPIEGSDWHGYHHEPRGRGGALLRTFDAKRLSEDYMAALTGVAVQGAPSVPVSEAEAWRRIDFFYERVLPVAESAGVRLTCHPNDPPLPVYRGAVQVLSTPDGITKLARRYPGPHAGLLFCMGTMQESGMDMPAALRKLVSDGRVFAIHFRNVEGTVPCFREVFHDEGDFDALAMMRLLRQAGYEGFILDDHLPRLTGDNERQDASRAWAMGYLRGMRQAAYSE